LEVILILTGDLSLVTNRLDIFSAWTVENL